MINTAPSSPSLFSKVQETTNLLSNIASDNVVSNILLDIDTVPIEGDSVVVAKIKEGLNKTYHDNKGIVWVKNGADKRKVFANAIYLFLYIGAGSGIQRAMSEEKQLSFSNNEALHEFVITIARGLETDSDTKGLT